VPFPYLTYFVPLSGPGLVFNCRIPDDCIDTRRYPLFMARDVMRRAIDLIKAKIQGSQAQ